MRRLIAVVAAFVLSLGAPLLFVATPATGQVFGGAVLQESGTFTATFDDACTTSPTWVFDYQRVGNIVVLQLVGGSWTAACTSDSTTVSTSAAALPATIRPANDTWSGVVSTGNWNDNSAQVMGGCVILFASGQIKLAVFRSTNGCQTSGWTGSGNKIAGAPPSTRAWTFTYMLGDP